VSRAHIIPNLALPEHFQTPPWAKHPVTAHSVPQVVIVRQKVLQSQLGIAKLVIIVHVAAQTRQQLNALLVLIVLWEVLYLNIVQLDCILIMPKHQFVMSVQKGFTAFQRMLNQVCKNKKILSIHRLISLQLYLFIVLQRLGSKLLHLG
jgi:hypothetical protein